MMERRELNEREREILNAAVVYYITSAEPVGSRSLVKRFNLPLSPATVRNTMADLEELGYLEQLHTSSGRVPTDEGYRYYVHYLMEAQELTLRERERIEQEYEQRLNDADQVLRSTSQMLSLLTHQAGLAEAPGDQDARVRRIELMPLSREMLAVLVADNFGRVHSLTVQTGEPILSDDMTMLTRFLNAHLSETPVDMLAASLERKLRNFLDEQRRIAERALYLLHQIPTFRPGQLFLEGATQLFEQPEFNDIARARDVVNLLEERNQLIDVLRNAVLENHSLCGPIELLAKDGKTNFEGLSLVASPYHVGGQPVGMIGVLGPRRMPYSKLTSVVDYTAQLLSRFLTRIGG